MHKIGGSQGLIHRVRVLKVEYAYASSMRKAQFYMQESRYRGAGHVLIRQQTVADEIGKASLGQQFVDVPRQPQLVFL
jgi:hypothetical protein